MAALSLRSCLAALVLSSGSLTGVVAGCASPDSVTDASAAGSVKIDLGTETSGSELTFEVPAGTTGFNIVVDARVTDDDFLGVQELRDPDGESIVADFKGVREEGRSLTGQSGTGVGVVRIPLVDNNASSSVKAGRWTVRLGGLTRDPQGPKGASTPWTGKAHGVVLLQTTKDGTFRGGALDLDIYVPDDLIVSRSPLKTVTAATAAADPDLGLRVDHAYELIQRLWGVDRGEVRFHRVKASIARLTSQAQVDAANKAANAETARPAGQIVLVNQLSPDGEDLGEISGVSNCLPGAVGIPGTKCSAVIVSLRESSDAWLDASVLVHELGHFVGLEHTTEFGGQRDALDDTPACEETEDKTAIQSCPDKNNIMFPSANLSSGEEDIWASETQRTIWQTSPIFRAR